MRPMMRCYQLTGFGQDLAAREQPRPVPTGTEVLVKIGGAGVSRQGTKSPPGEPWIQEAPGPQCESQARHRRQVWRWRTARSDVHLFGLYRLR